MMGKGKPPKYRYQVNPQLDKNALQVLEKRALRKDKRGRVIESPDELFHRVARVIISAEELYDVTFKRQQEIEDQFYEMLARLEFVSGQALRNATLKSMMFSACFVLPVGDSMDSIFEAVKENMIVQKKTGGVGFNFSNLRARGMEVGGIGPVAAGPVGFLKAFDATQDTIITRGGRKQGSMAILNIDHPDIEEFIYCKEDKEAITNFNISVGLTDDFMERVKKEEKFELIDPWTKKVLKVVEAEALFERIITQAHKTGDPGAIFLDRVQRDNPTPGDGILNATNVCGEQPLLPYESCNLGSIVLSRMLKKTARGYRIDWRRLEKVTRLGVRFLDNTIDLNRYPLPKIEWMSKRNRRIGLGVMGFADMLIKLGIPYNSREAEKTAEQTMKFINETAREESHRLAEEKGPFPNFPHSVWNNGGLLNSKLGGKIMRNSAVTTIAPTGYTSIVAGCSSGIEPLFALAYVRTIARGEGGVKQVEINKEFEKVARERGFYSKELLSEAAKTGSCQNIKEVPEDIKKIFVTAYDSSPQWHVRIQAAFQRYTENAVSKTINFPSSATVEDVGKAYMQAWELGCKGITIYRDKSKCQVLEAGIK